MLKSRKKYTTPLPIGHQIVLGIDPGKKNVGWSITQRQSNAYIVCKCGTENPNGQSIERKINELIRLHSPDAVVVEKLESATDEWFRDVAGCVAQIRSIADQRDIECYFYSPQDVKYAVTGNRKASKEEVELAVKRVCILKEIPKSDHSADAIAASLCYLRNYLNYSRFQDKARVVEYYNSGSTYLDNKQYNEAIAKFEEAINNTPMIDSMYVKAHCGLSRAYLGQSKLEAAENAVQEVLRLAENNHPDSQKLLGAIRHYRSGCNTVNNKRFNEAITEFQKSINLEPFFIQARYELSRAQLRLSNLEIAKNAVEEALKFTNDHSPIHLLSEAIRLYNEGRDSLHVRQYNDAIGKLKEAIDRESNFTEAHYWLGYAHFHNETLEAAEQSANDTLELNTNHQLARALLDDIKKAYVDNGYDALERLDLTEADKYANKAFHIDKNCQLGHKLFEKIKQTYYNQACDCLNNKRYDLAIFKFNKLINKDPSFIDAYCGLAKAYLGQGSLKGAGNYIEDLRDAENYTEEALKLDKNYKHCPSDSRKHKAKIL